MTDERLDNVTHAMASQPHSTSTLWQQLVVALAPNAVINVVLHKQMGRERLGSITHL